MVYRFLMLSNENDFFRREFLIDSEATFLEFNDFILDSLGYVHNELTTFHLCDQDWNKMQEVTRLDMELSSDEDNFLMERTRLEELIEQKGQRLFFVFDMLEERGFFLELMEMMPGKGLAKPEVSIAEGKAPIQISSVETASDLTSLALGDIFGDEDDIDEDRFNEDELDLEGFDISDAESLF